MSRHTSMWPAMPARAKTDAVSSPLRTCSTLSSSPTARLCCANHPEHAALLHLFARGGPQPTSRMRPRRREDTVQATSGTRDHRRDGAPGESVHPLVEHVAAVALHL